jgi:hypothetical protein
MYVKAIPGIEMGYFALPCPQDSGMVRRFIEGERLRFYPGRPGTVCTTVCAYGRFGQVQYRGCIVAFPIVPACTVRAGCIGQPNIGRLTLAARDAGGQFDVSGPDTNRLPSFCM